MESSLQKHYHLKQRFQWGEEGGTFELLDFYKSSVGGVPVGRP